MRHVVVMGKGSLAIQIAEWFKRSSRYYLISVVPVLPEPDWAPSLREWAELEKVPVVERHDAIAQVDLVFSVYYDKILPREFIERHGRVLNIHNSILPYYRGVRPINWVLKDHSHQHGVTIHEVDEGIDTGPIISQVMFDIHPEFEEVRDVYHRCLSYGWLLFKETMPNIDRIQPWAQRNSDHFKRYTHTSAENHLLEERSGWMRQSSS